MANGCELALGLLLKDAVAQTTEEPQEVRGVSSEPERIAIGDERYDHVDALKRQGKVPRKNPDDSHRFTVDSEGAADEVGASELTLPQTMAQHRHWGRAWIVVALV